MRALGTFYLRLTGTSLDCYKYLEPLLNDFRKIRKQVGLLIGEILNGNLNNNVFYFSQTRDGKFILSHMDEFVDELLREERALDVILPRMQVR